MSSSLYVQADLGISSVISASKINTRGQTSIILGKFITAYDLNNPIYLKTRPNNTTINVKIMDNSTGSVYTDLQYDYVLQLFLERVR